jgi:hypothetical protein
MHLKLRVRSKSGLSVGFVLAGLAILLAGVLVTTFPSPGSARSASAETSIAQRANVSNWESRVGHEVASTGAGVRLEAAQSASNLPADCIPKQPGPPGAPYQLGIVGTVHNGELIAGPATIADITAKFCGVVTVVPGHAPCEATGSVVSPEDGQIFGSLSAELTMIPGMDPKVPFVAHPGTITGGFGCVSSVNGLEVSLKAVVSGSTGVFGLSCTIGPLTIALSGVVTGPLNNAAITLRGNDFAVPAVKASPDCAGQVPANLNQLAGLPIAPGGATASLPATTSIYQPSG